MVDKNKIFAVLTGDLVKSTKKINKRDLVMSVIKDSFKLVDDTFPGLMYAPFYIYRGDSFQGVMSQPETALRAAIIMRTGLLFGFDRQVKAEALDTRIVIGIGTIDFLPKRRGAEGDGIAFRLSGKTLDKKEKDRRLLIRTPWEELNKELDTECALFDALVNRWSPEQAQAIHLRIKKEEGLTQQEIARNLGITQPAVRSRLHGAGNWAVEEFLRRFEKLLHNKIEEHIIDKQL